MVSDGNAGFVDDELCREWSWRKSKQRIAGSRGCKDIRSWTEPDSSFYFDAMWSSGSLFLAARKVDTGQF